MLGLRLWLPVCLLALVAGCPHEKTMVTEADLLAVDLTGALAPDLVGVTQDLATPSDVDLAGEDLVAPTEEDLATPDLATGITVDLRTDIKGGPDLRDYKYQVLSVVPNEPGSLLITYFGLPSQLATSGKVTFKITLLDTDGDAAVGVNLKLTLPPGWAILTQSLTTDGDGEASFEVYAGPVPGTFPLTIEGPSVEPYTADLTSVQANADAVLPLVNWLLTNPDATAAATLPRPAIDNPMLGPYGIAPDASGGYFFPDLPQHRVFHVDASGVLSLIAGTGVNTDPGEVIVDGTLATEASIYGPQSLVFDSTNQLLYFLDQTTFVDDNQYKEPLGASKVRLVDMVNGQIFTIAGGNSANPLDTNPLAVPLAAYHLAVDPATSTLAIADRGTNDGAGTNRIRLISGGVASVLLSEPVACVTATTFAGCTGTNAHCPLSFNAAGDTLFMAGRFCTSAGPVVDSSSAAIASVALSNGAVTILKQGAGEPLLLADTLINLHRSGTTLYLSSTMPGVFSLDASGSSASTLVIGDGPSGFVDYVSRTEATLSGYVIGAPRSDGRLVFSMYDDPQAYAGIRIVW